jgi:hypothetical protein
MNHPSKRRFRRSVFIEVKRRRERNEKVATTGKSLTGVYCDKAPHKGIQIGLGISWATMKGRCMSDLVNKT